MRKRVWWPVVCVAALAALAVGAGAAHANQLVTITLPDRHGEIPSRWLTYPGSPRADVLLPDRYDPRRRYPLIVLLPGFSNTYAILGPSMLDAQKVLAGLQAIVVAPEGETGWYADWYNNGAYGTPEWESYILDEAIPQIVQRYKVLPQRRYHALFGISMGGLGATYLGGRLPGFFGSIGALSGFVDPQIAPGIVSVSMDELSGARPGSVIGPESGFYATGHNPTALVHNLQHTRVFVSTGNGVPTPADGTGGGVGNAEEAGVIRPMSDAYDAALKAAGIDVTYQTHDGCHCWPDFQAELRNAIAWGPFKPVVEHASGWVNDTVATHGQLWDIGYRFTSHPTAVVRFTRTGSRLRISAAGSPVTLTTSRGCVLRVATPANVRIPSNSCARTSADASTASSQPFGHVCTMDSAGMRFCPTPAPTSSSDERVRSWDGAPLQVDVTLPPTGNGPWPTIVMLPGYGGSDGVSWEASNGSSGSNEGAHFNNDWFAEHGYAVVTMNFRGVGYSCGPPYAASVTNDIWRTADAAACRNVAFEFGDQRYDARDVQWVLGRLVDQGIAKPQALGVAGESLGSLVTLELALLYNRIRLLDGSFAPWKSPNGAPLRISAAYPIWSVASLMDGVAPNGRFLSFKPQSAANDNEPVGAIKLSVPMAIAAEAPAGVKTVPPHPDGFDLFVDTLYSELAAPNGPGAAALVRQIRDYHQSVGMPIGSGVAPILMEEGWGDLLVNGASQALRLVDYLKEAAPRAKVALQLADVGHPLATNKPADFTPLDSQATAFLNHYLQGAPGGPAPGSVTAYASTCPASVPSAGPYVANGMAALDPGAVRFSSATPQTVVGGGDPSIGVALDPIVNTGAQPALGADPQCQTFTPANWPGTAVYTHPVTQTFTMLGLPTMRLHVATTGNLGQLDARLWDVAPGGSETYVSRGTYALTDNQTGTITWQMWGAGHTFHKGDTIRVELLAQDTPLERPSPRPFTLTVSDFTIELPSHQAPDGGEIVKPILGVTR